MKDVVSRYIDVRVVFNKEVRRPQNVDLSDPKIEALAHLIQTGFEQNQISARVAITEQDDGQNLQMIVELDDAWQAEHGMAQAEIILTRSINNTLDGIELDGRPAPQVAHLEWDV
jgi:hypothetical protein